MRNWFVAIAVPLLAWSCSEIFQKVVLKPEARVAPTEIGQQKPVAVTVLDERPRAVIGYRGRARYSFTGAITTDQDVDFVIQEAIFHGLRRKGFTPVTGSGPRMLKVDVQAINYSIFAVPLILAFDGPVIPIIRSDVVLKVTCSGSAGSYVNLSRGEIKERGFPPFAAENEKIINLALSQAIERVFDDAELLNCLAK